MSRSNPSKWEDWTRSSQRERTSSNIHTSATALRRQKRKSRAPVHHALWVAAANRQETQNEWSMLYTNVLLASHVALGADQDRAIAKTFKVGDHVSWNSEAGRVRGKIVKVHKRAVNYKGYIHRATPDDPQYEIKSDKTDHVALHKAGVLRRLG